MTDQVIIEKLTRIEAELVRARQERRLNRRLKERSERFRDEFRLLDAPDKAYGLRVTAAPVSRLPLQPFSGSRQTLLGELGKLGVTEVARLVGDTKRLPVSPPPRSGEVLSISRFRSMLRAIRSTNRSRHQPSHQYSYLELHRDGLVEFGFLSCINVSRVEGRHLLVLFPDYAVSTAANVLSWADAFRRFGELPHVKYAVQVAIHVENEDLCVYQPGPEVVGGLDVMGKIKRGVTILPKMSFCQDTEAATLLSDLECDLVNVGGKHYSTDSWGKLQILRPR